MRESQIRPEKLMQENARLRRADLRRLVKQKHQFVLVNCPACDSRQQTRLWVKDNFRFVRCRKCDTVFISPRPSQAILGNFYQQALSIKHWNDEIFPASEEMRRKQIFKPRAQRVKELCHRYRVRRKLLVDVGAGFGTFGEEITKLKLFNRIVMVEPSPDLAETCRRKNLEVVEDIIENTNLNQIDVMTNFELIEHLFSPKKFIQACARALSKRGLLILTTPNIKGFDLMVLGKASNHIAGPNHLNYFHPASLRNLVEKCGLKVVEVLTPGELDVDVVKQKVLNGEISLGQQPVWQEILFNQGEATADSFQKFLQRHNLSSHMWLVAQKS